MRGSFRNGDGNVTNPATSEGGDPGGNYTDEHGHVWPLLAEDHDGFVITKWRTDPPADNAYGRFDAKARIGVSLNQSDLVDSIDQYVVQFDGQQGRVTPPDPDDSTLSENLRAQTNNVPNFVLVLVVGWLVFTDKRGRRR